MKPQIMSEKVGTVIIFIIVLTKNCRREELTYRKPINSMQPIGYRQDRSYAARALFVIFAGNVYHETDQCPINSIRFST